ncbi:hypothetical protein [Microbacter margulisiae]|uniref:Uncharacterized protein n=1 Tax=Microbacter margulisiae TaxID=1350067 RepID=A0A7W5H069_9PORP|nr:hypothetical protein [Microbacter margulisiae]MBB3186228.1 hypothetical protein [Microbacter margulisiae]
MAPISILNAPISILNAPFSTLNAPISTLNAPFSILNAPFSTLNAPFSTLNAPFSILNAPFSILNAPFSTLNAPFSTLNVPFSIVIISIPTEKLIFQMLQHSILLESAAENYAMANNHYREKTDFTFSMIVCALQMYFVNIKIHIGNIHYFFLTSLRQNQQGLKV